MTTQLHHLCPDWLKGQQNVLLYLERIATNGSAQNVNIRIALTIDNCKSVEREQVNKWQMDYYITLHLVCKSKFCVYVFTADH